MCVDSNFSLQFITRWSLTAQGPFWGAPGVPGRKRSSRTSKAEGLALQSCEVTADLLHLVTITGNLQSAVLKHDRSSA